MKQKTETVQIFVFTQSPLCSTGSKFILTSPHFMPLYINNFHSPSSPSTGSLFHNDSGSYSADSSFHISHPLYFTLGLLLFPIFLNIFSKLFSKITVVLYKFVISLVKFAILYEIWIFLRPHFYQLFVHGHILDFIPPHIRFAFLNLIDAIRITFSS